MNRIISSLAKTFKPYKTKNMKENLLGKKLFIDWDEAKQLIGQYNRHPKKIITEVLDANDRSQDPPVFKTLSGFSFPKSEVQAIIEQSGTERFFIALAYHDDTIRPAEKKGFSAVIMGMDENDDLLVEGYHKISDYCEPCPSRCPNNHNLENL